MDISSLGEFKFIDCITEPFKSKQPSTLFGIGDDAAVLKGGSSSKLTLLSTDLMLEGIAFDLTYFPLQHLGYKCIVAACSDICAMNGTAHQITVSIGVSARFSVEDIQLLYSGIHKACADYNLDLIGGDTTSSLTGLTISVSVVGSVGKGQITYRKGAQPNDIICVTGDLGSSFLGLQLLEREKRVLKGNTTSEPKLSGYEYLLERQLKPALRSDVIESMAQAKIVPTSMIDLSDGLASDLLQICKSSEVGARIYLDKLPISSKSFELADELKIDPVMCALNGGDDYELLFTLPVDMYNNIVKMGSIDVIGHITTKDKGVAMATPDGAEITIVAQGWLSE